MRTLPKSGRGVILDSIEDFSGGMNTLLAPNRIQKNESPTCLNVWSETGALKKRRGYSTTTPTAGGFSLTSISDPFLANLGGTYYYIINANWNSGAKGLFYANTPSSSTFSPVSYNSGTVTTNGTHTATGSGTTWTSLAPLVGRLFFRVSGDSTLANIVSIESDTSMTLGPTYSSHAGATYDIVVACNEYISYAVLNNNLYGGTSNVSLFQWVPGGNLTGIAGGPKATSLTAYSNYLFASQSTVSASRVYWSALKDGTTWPGTNFVDVSKDTGDSVTGFGIEPTSMVVFKNSSAWKLNGNVFDPSNPTYSVSAINSPPNAQFTMPRTFKQWRGLFYMFGGDGIYSYNGSSFIRVDLSDKLQSEWGSVLQGGATGNPFSIGTTSSSMVWNNRYWMSLWGVGALTGYIVDTTGSMWKWSSSTTNLFGQLFSFSNTSTNTLELYGATADGNILKVDTTSSDGTNAINGTWTSKVFDYDSQQSFGRVWVDLKKQSAGNLVLEYSIDEGSFTAVNIDMTYAGPSGGATRVKSQEIIVGQVGQSIQWRLSNNVAGQDFEVYAITWERRPLRN